MHLRFLDCTYSCILLCSRVINELWRENLFQLAITYHAGMRAITYEWGTPNHISARSPDDTSQVLLGSALAQFAGPFADGKLYPTGTMNDVVYGVYGGMEDWGYGSIEYNVFYVGIQILILVMIFFMLDVSYAASWENQYAAEPIFKPCHSTRFGGYPPEKTEYNNMTHRAFNILVETSDAKSPRASALGQRAALYNVDLEVVHPTFYSIYSTA
jgi:hypothetical protein